MCIQMLFNHAVEKEQYIWHHVKKVEQKHSKLNMINHPKGDLKKKKW
jgi:hypothetical protein